MPTRSLDTALWNPEILTVGRRVKVYRNLRRDCFSIVDVSTRRVCAYSKKLWLSNVEFKVSEAGRQRVLQSKKKNVHAWVVGTVMKPPPWFKGALLNRLRYVWYNPYSTRLFKTEDSSVALRARAALLKDNKIWIDP